MASHSSWLAFLKLLMAELAEWVSCDLSSFCLSPSTLTAQGSVKRVISWVPAQRDQTFSRYHLAAVQYQSLWPPAHTRSLFCLEGPSSVGFIYLFPLLAFLWLYCSALSYYWSCSQLSAACFPFQWPFPRHLPVARRSSCTWSCVFSPENLHHWIVIFPLVQQAYPRMVLLS